MKATFRIEPKQIRFFNDEMMKRTGSSNDLNIQGYWSHNEGRTLAEVYGNAQDVMFLIGEVAANGEDGLLSVER